MNAKKILLFSVLFITVSIQAHSQQRRDEQRQRGPNSERMITAMKEKLDLSEEQVTKVRDIYKKSGEEFGKLREDSSLSEDQKREKLKALRSKQQEDINAILTEEQRKELKAWREEQQGQRQRRKPGRQPDSQ